MAFTKGKSGNPAGRPPGTGNVVTRAVRERIMEGDPLKVLLAFSRGEPLIFGEGTAAERRIDPAAGDVIRAAAILTSKVVPDIKDATIRFPLPEIGSAKDALAAISAVLKAVAEGELSPSEGDAICGLIRTYLTAFEVNDLEARLTALEQAKESRR